MTNSQDTFVMSVSGEMMEVLDKYRLEQKIETVKEDPVQRQILRVILKCEMQSLLQRLAEIGEESVVVTANVVDGTHSVLASDQGEKFLHNGVVSNFMDHFVRYLYTGETPNSINDGTGSLDAYSLKCGNHRLENNLSRSSVSSSDEPETFMHMKKHQIEQFNRRKDQEDRAVDETVSILVRNILREGKEKERRNSSTSGHILAQAKRKRKSIDCNQAYPGSQNSETCSAAKKKPIAELFPKLSPSLSKSSSENLSDTLNQRSEENVKNNFETSDDEVTGITIKIEPDYEEGYGGAVLNTYDKNDTNSVSEEKNLDDINSSDCSSQGEASDKAKTTKESLKTAKYKDSRDPPVVQCNDNRGNSADKSENSPSLQICSEKDGQTCVGRKGKGEDDIELPFVEEYYQNRGKCVEDVKLTPEEIGAETTRKTFSDVSCYKQSRKKSSTYNLVLNGYLYIKDKQSSTGTIYWKCGRVGCKGRVIQRGQELIVSQTHIHDPQHKQEG